MKPIGDHEEMRMVFRGREYRLVFNCDREARRMSGSCSVRTGDGWQEIHGHPVGENEIVFRRSFETAIADAIAHGGEA